MVQVPEFGERPWHSLYPAGIPTRLQLEHDNALDMFRACVAARADQAALYYFDLAYTFGDLDVQSNALAVWLQEQKVKPGDRVSVITQNTPSFVCAVLAAWKIGAIANTNNPMYRASELAHILSDASPSALICQDIDHLETAEALKRAGLDVPILVTSPRDGQTNNDGRVLPPTLEVAGADRFADIVKQRAGRCPELVPLNPDDTALILYTSGTTGRPKGAMLTHRSLAFNAQFTRDWCALTPESRILAIAPFFHVTGFVCHICAAFSAQCSLVVNFRFEPNVVLDMVRKWKPTFTIGAITALNALKRIPDITPSDMASFERIYTGGAPIPPALRRDIEAALGVVIFPTYGMTETAAPATFTPFGTHAPILDDALSVGVPIPSTDIRIVDDTGRQLPSGEPGEILIRGPQVMKGYWRNSDETAEALRDGWMHSGDIGIMDESGWLYLVDRKKDVIIASGFKVWPREIEDVLYEYPSVREVAVVGAPDDYRGETVTAFVSAQAGAKIDEAALLKHCRERLAAYKVPRLITVLEDLPKTVSGKIQRAALRPAPKKA